MAAPSERSVDVWTKAFDEKHQQVVQFRNASLAPLRLAWSQTTLRALPAAPVCHILAPRRRCSVRHNLVPFSRPQHFYSNQRTGVSSWQQPDDAWLEVMDPSNDRPFYFHTTTRESRPVQPARDVAVARA